MLAVITLVIMLVVAYAHFREGIFTALSMLINIILAGVVTCNFYEPLADYVDPLLVGSFLAGYEDFLFMLLLFAGTLGLLRMVTNNLANILIEYHPLLQQLGAGLLGLVSGYLLGGFLLCLLQTLPWHVNFMEFQPRDRQESPLRGFFPSDRVWLALMRHAGAYALSRDPDNDNADSPFDRYATFDRPGNFELRYLRYRRYNNTRNPMPYERECDHTLKRRP